MWRGTRRNVAKWKDPAVTLPFARPRRAPIRPQGTLLDALIFSAPLLKPSGR